MIRKITKAINIGGVTVGGGAPISIQSMTNTKTWDTAATIAQIKALADAGCEIVRLAVPDKRSADVLPTIIEASPVPLVADIHFDYRLALASIDAGIHKLRINPGNLKPEHVAIVAKAAKAAGVPIRVGVNSGSMPMHILEKHGNRVNSDNLCEAALEQVKTLENIGFYDIVIAIKASSAPVSIEAYKQLSERVDYPLHVGITEAGTTYAGTVKSAVGIGAVLSMGIGDTIRVSLTADPVEEVRAAKEILQSLELRRFGVRVVCCPTCGRAELDLIGLAHRVEAAVMGIQKPIKIAVMGCIVNGPGEARDADLGIAGGKGFGILFKKGEIVKRVPEAELFDALMWEVEQLM